MRWILFKFWLHSVLAPSRFGRWLRDLPAEEVMDRYWINQPGRLQPLHYRHGERVLAPRDIAPHQTSVRVYPLGYGDVISYVAPTNALSRGSRPERKRPA